MTYITDEEMAALPDDPMEAFVSLERIVRGRYELEVRKIEDNVLPTPSLNNYVAHVYPAARVYGVEPLCNLARPKPHDYGELSDFMSEVDFILTELRLRNISRAKKNSVALDAATKARLRNQLNEIRQTIDKLDVPAAKREALYERINAVQAEIDRDRTNAQAFGALLFEVLHGVSAAAEPLVKQVERLGSALGLAIATEASQPKLPSPKTPKQIEGPKKPAEKKSSGFDKKLDDEIPF